MYILYSYAPCIVAWCVSLMVICAVKEKKKKKKIYPNSGCVHYACIHGNHYIFKWYFPGIFFSILVHCHGHVSYTICIHFELHVPLWPFISFLIAFAYILTLTLYFFSLLYNNVYSILCAVYEYRYYAQIHTHTIITINAMEHILLNCSFEAIFKQHLPLFSM